MVVLTTEPLDAGRLIASVQSEDCGAVTAFLGVVRRDAGQDGTVEGITYEAHDAMARGALEAIGAELSRFGRVRWTIAHRLGALKAGEVSVVIAVASPHRAEAFAACRRAIEELKARVPIWKRELLDSGADRWVEGAPIR